MVKAPEEGREEDMALKDEGRGAGGSPRNERHARQGHWESRGLPGGSRVQGKPRPSLSGGLRGTEGVCKRAGLGRRV